MSATVYLLVICLFGIHIDVFCCQRCEVLFGVSTCGYFADCKNNRWQIVPQNITPARNISELDLSHNNITTITSKAFEKYSNLLFLNLSFSFINNLHEQSFGGLKNLETLDLSNNPILHRLPLNLFASIVSLKKLHIYGRPISIQSLLPLVSLAELVLSVNPNEISDDFLELPTNLSVLTIAYSRLFNLTRTLLQPLRKSNLKELAFHVCDVHYIENGAFDDFTELRLLNMFGNIHLTINNVIDALSKSDQIHINALVLDLLNIETKDLLFLGQQDSPQCRSAWMKLTKLSMRGVNLLGASDNFVTCWQNLQSLALGFNAPIFGITHILPRMVSLKYLDISFWMHSDTFALKHYEGYYNIPGWFLQNKDFFPWYPDQNRSEISRTVDVQHTMDNYNGLCHVSKDPMPANLLYIKADHINHLIGGKIKSDCEVIPENKVRYLNISNRHYNRQNGGLTIDVPIYGLNNLEVIDFTSYGILSWNLSNLQFFPSLTEFYAADNSIGLHNISEILGNNPNLKIIDFSKNAITHLPQTMFRNVVALETLKLNDNSLKHVNFLTPRLQRLSALFVNDNQITSLDTFTMQILDNISTHHQFTLGMINNPFKCDCEQLEFIEWVQTTKVDIIQRSDLQCSISSLFIVDVDTHGLHYKCSNTSHKIILSGVVLGISVILIISGILLYKYRWSIKWRYYKVRYLSKKNCVNIVLRSIDHEDKFSAYVIFPMEDDGIRAWVFGDLRTKVESVWQKRQLYLRGRDDIPGDPEIDNIVAGIMNSQVALWVVCPTFFEDRMCEIAAHFAFNELGPKNNVLLIMENRFDKYTVPKQFMSMMNFKMGVKRLCFTINEDGQNLFWSELDDVIPV